MSLFQHIWELAPTTGTPEQTHSDRLPPLPAPGACAAGTTSAAPSGAGAAGAAAAGGATAWARVGAPTEMAQVGAQRLWLFRLKGKIKIEKRIK